MDNWSRRDILKTGLGASLGASFISPALRRVFAITDAARILPSEAPSPRERLLFDFGWRFHLGNANDPARDFDFGVNAAFGKSGALFKPAWKDFDDHGWRTVDLPHDWAVELDFVRDAELVNNGFKPLGRSYPATSIGWYRRVFEIPKSDEGRRISIEFDGVFRDAIVAINGTFLGRNLSGYAPFRFDITDLVNFGDTNCIAVRADATEHEGWFYEGAGIYRHVWLVKTNPVHVANGGVLVTSAIRPNAAELTIRTEIENDSDHEQSVRAVSAIVDPSGKIVGTVRSNATTIAPRSSAEVVQQAHVGNPALWSIETPNLYQLRTTITVNDAEVDRLETNFGIRSIRFDANEGFFLNGKHVEIKGTCNHQDHAGVGAALPDRIQYYRIERLKAMRSNAYRTSHNPPTPALLDACDRLGMLVMDETRMFSSEPEGLSQLARMVRRDRNHPCIFLWSIGNEEQNEQWNSRGARIAETMKATVLALDPSRPVSAAMDNGWGIGMSPVLDVQGFNYEQLSNDRRNLDAYRKRYPDKPSIGTEVGSTVSTRGIYENDDHKGYVRAYDTEHPWWSSTAEEWWTRYAARPWIAGGFVWTGFDYRGEPTPYEWPCISSHFGVMDTCGFPKDNFFYYKAWWSGEPVLHLFPHWNWAGREGKEIEVWCHSNCERIELFLNGASLGAQDVPRNSHVVWKVPYAPGTLEARGMTGGKVVLTDKRETTGGAARIILRPDRANIAADGEDVSMIEVQVVDAEGRIVPVADNEITFAITGSGKLIGVGNGDPSSHESDKGTSRATFNGVCMAIVQSTKDAGDITIEATSPSLASGKAVVSAKTATPRPAVA